MAGKRAASTSAKQASPPSKAPRKGATKAATSPAKERRAGSKKAEAPARAQDARKQADAGKKAEAAAPAAKRKAEEARRRAEAEAAAAQRRGEEEEAARKAAEEAARKAAEEAARKAAEEAEAKRRADAEAARARAPEALREAREKAEAAEAAAMGLAEQGEVARQAASAAAAENFRASSAASEAQAAAAAAQAAAEKLASAVEEARRALERAEAEASSAREKADADAEASARLAAEAQAAARASDEKARRLADHRLQERSAASLRSQERSRTAAEMKVLCQHLELKIAAAEDESGGCFLEAVADFVQKEIAAAAPPPAESAAAVDDAPEVPEGMETAAAEPATADEVSAQAALAEPPDTVQAQQAQPEQGEAMADQQAAPVAAPQNEGKSAPTAAEAVADSESTPVALATEAPAATQETAASAADADAADTGAPASSGCVANDRDVVMEVDTTAAQDAQDAQETKEAERKKSEAAAEEAERAAKEAAEEARRIAAFAMLGVSIVTAEPKKVTGLGSHESQPVAQPQGCTSGSSGACGSSSACGDASCGGPAHATAPQTAAQTDASADVDDATTFQIAEVEGGSWAENAAFMHQRMGRDLAAQLEALEAKTVQERQAEEAHTAAKARHEAKEEQARPDAAAKEEALKQAQRKKESFVQEVAEMKAVHELFKKVHKALASAKSPGTEAAALHPRVQKSGALPQDLLTSLGQVVGRKRRAKGDMKVLTEADTALTDRVRLMSTYQASVDSEVARCSSEVAAAIEAAQARAKELATFADALAARQEYRRRQEAEVGAARQRLQEHEDRMVAERIMRFNLGPETCMICTEEFSACKCVWLGCDHGWFCKECLRRHVEARLDNGIAGDIPCPSCGDPISEKDLITLLPRKVIFRLHSRTCEQKAVASGARQCPTPNCPWRFSFTEGDDPCQKCPLCEKSSCALCGAQPYHEGMTCQQYAAHAKEDESLQEWIKATGSKRCPTCGVVTTKENLEKQSQQRVECHKMLCRNCNTKWCFKCCAVLTDTYTCGCTQDAHGFIDPNTGKIVKHLKKGTKRKTAE